MQDSKRKRPPRPRPPCRRLAASRPPARPRGPAVPGRQRRRPRRCSSRTRSAPPRSPRSRSPALGGGSSSLLVPAASSRQHQAQGTLRRRRRRRRRRQLRVPLRTPPTYPKPEMAAAPPPIPGRAVTWGGGALPQRTRLAQGSAAKGEPGCGRTKRGSGPTHRGPIWTRRRRTPAAVWPITGENTATRPATGSFSGGTEGLAPDWRRLPGRGNNNQGKKNSERKMGREFGAKDNNNMSHHKDIKQPGVWADNQLASLLFLVPGP
ncbi:serine/arginine repetitive matrix protein 1-like [Dasypus novemcinctus]|uniref:serine/arginine repetitive matrix protein 1-like n=1 Tax=Dasypus novemcinctus TaxID=9361 RepID=UPI00265DEA3D|nr:transmembrane protein 108-like [Dasypus novemcinctus]